MKSLTIAQTRVLTAAYSRMRDQAKQLRGCGIVDVCVTKREVDRDLWEFTAQGTAVRLCRPEADNALFACTFTGQNYFALTMAGYRPVGVALGVCVYYQKFHQRVQQKIEGPGRGANRGQNSERSDFTRGLYTARRAAMAALEAEAAVLGAAGVIGVSVTTKRTLNHERGSSQGMLIEFTAIGTAVTASPSTAATSIVNYALPLTG